MSDRPPEGTYEREGGWNYPLKVFAMGVELPRLTLASPPLMLVLVCGVGQGCQHFGVLSDQPHKSAARQKEGGKILSCSTCAKQSIGSFKAFSYLLNP